MLTERIARTIEVFRDIVGKQAYMLVESVDGDGLPSSGTEYRRAIVGLTGALRGSVTLIVPAEMCREIAANVLGIVSTEHLAEVRAEDSFVELANVTCGHLGAALGGQVRTTLPELSSIGAEEWANASRDPETLRFLVDDFPVLLTLRIEENGP